MRLLYLVACIEWFSTLAIEILALRIAAPVTGSSSIVTSVFLGIILLALSAGYWMGGHMASTRDRSQIIALLTKYLLFAGVYYAIVSFGLESWMLTWILESTGSYIGTLFLTALFLFFLPVFVASQTIPLLTELLDEKSTGKAAGKMLFASTVGSFFGSILTSIVLFQTRGVTLTAIIVSCLLVATAGLLVWKTSKKRAILIVVFAVLLWSALRVWRSARDSSIVYSFDSAYQHISIEERSYKDRPLRVFLTDNAYASALFVDTHESPFEYISEAAALTEKLAPERVLVIGTAGFTFPYEIATKISGIEQIDAVDVDSRVQDIAEKYFLQTKLPDIIDFYPESARYFIEQARKNKQSYEIIFVDAFHGKSLPAELTTQEFFIGLKQLLSPNGVVMINFILDRSLESDLARSLFTTIESVFDEVWVKQTTENDEHLIENFIVTTKKLGDAYTSPVLGSTIYTDDKRSTEIDTMKMYRGRE